MLKTIPKVILTHFGSFVNIPKDNSRIKKKRCHSQQKCVYTLVLTLILWCLKNKSQTRHTKIKTLSKHMRANSWNDKNRIQHTALPIHISPEWNATNLFFFFLVCWWLNCNRVHFIFVKWIVLLCAFVVVFRFGFFGLDLFCSRLLLFIFFTFKVVRVTTMQNKRVHCWYCP